MPAAGWVSIPFLKEHVHVTLPSREKKFFGSATSFPRDGNKGGGDERSPSLPCSSSRVLGVKALAHCPSKQCVAEESHCRMSVEQGHTCCVFYWSLCTNISHRERERDVHVQRCIPHLSRKARTTFLSSFTPPGETKWLPVVLESLFSWLCEVVLLLWSSRLLCGYTVPACVLVVFFF